MTATSLPEAVAALVTTETEYAAAQARADDVLSQTQQLRETAMRRVAALGLSHRRIGELTGLSHTRVNQILGSGRKRPPDDIHFPPGFLPAPTTVERAALRVIAEQGPRAWRTQEIQAELAHRGWPAENLRDALIGLVTEGVLLSVDGGYFTLHGYGYPGQTPPRPVAI
jgi:hypothetical protein